MVNLDTILLGMPWSLGDHQCSNTTPPHETNDQSLKKWKVQTRKTMFIIKVSIEEDMLEHIKNPLHLKLIGILLSLCSLRKMKFFYKIFKENWCQSNKMTW